MGIAQLANQKTLILDGAMGTMIQRYPLTEKDFRGDILLDHPTPLKGNNDLLCMTKPEIITAIHLEYLEAGADIVETNTFNAQRVSLDDYGLTHLVTEINTAAVECAKKAVELYYNKHGRSKRKFIAGAVGPTSKTASMSPLVEDPAFRAVSFDELSNAYFEQIEALVLAGVDAVLIETIFDTLNAKAAFHAALEVFKKHKRTPITPNHPNGDIALMASGTITDAAGRTLSGQTAAAFAISLEHLPLFSIGLNCALGADSLLPHIKEIQGHTACLVSAYPNAGLPNALGGYDELPQEMAEKMAPYLTGNHIHILGGCCGTTPDHIAAFAKLANQLNSAQ